MMKIGYTDDVIDIFEEYYRPGTSCLFRNGERYTVICTEPESIFEGRDISRLRDILERRKTEYNPHFPPFTGGAAGYITYDTVRMWEDIGGDAYEDIAVPYIYMGIYTKAVVIDHFLGKVFRFGKSAPSGYKGKHIPDIPARFSPSLSREYFCDMVLRAKEYIAAGDIYQINLSHRMEAHIGSDALSFYERLCRINPSPFAGFMDMAGIRLIGCSPERLVRVKGSRVETRPIAGTYPRGRTKADDTRFAQSLLSHPKERAEHIMLVDLERNDLGRVCRYGTIKVNEFMVLESYSHVHHIVSNIEGIKRNRVSSVDILKAVFPGGTITGCPKVRCMQIIDELEPVRRNVYTGSMGWIGFNGNMDMNIIIRTLLETGGRAYLHTGAGIVADSVPEREYEETLHKASALLEAGRYAESGCRQC